MVTPSVLRVLFLGTPDFAVPTLEGLIASPHAVVGVVTQPDRPRGRGQLMQAPPVKQVAERAGLRTWQPERLKQPGFYDEMRALMPDLGVVAAYGKILSPEFLSIPRLGMINVHASLLPRWRGASPIQHAVMAGDTETGITIMRVVKELDAGAALLSGARPIGPDETAADVERDLATIGADLLLRAVSQLAAGTAIETAQDESRVTYAPRLAKQDGDLDWSLDARVLHARVRGLHPWPLARAYLDGHPLTVRRVQLAPDTHLATPGTILAADRDRLLVACGGGSALRLVEVQPEGKRPMSAREFLAGHRIAPGTAFSAPPAR